MHIMVDMREIDRVFESKDIYNSIKFYSYFNNAEQLLQWLKDRPKGKPKIYVISGDPAISVVILTQNYYGKLARNCKEFYKGMQMIFVQSNRNYFNYSHNCNTGFKYALKYKPKWVVLSNDDIYKISDIEKLKNELDNISNKSIDIVGLETSNPILRPTFLLGKRCWLLKLLRYFRGSYRKIYQIGLDKFDIEYEPVYTNLRAQMSNWLLHKNLVNLNIGIKFTFFSIFSSRFIEKNEAHIFDEMYPYDHEDEDVSLRIMPERCTTVSFKIGHYRGKTLGIGQQRKLSKLIGLFYLDYKIKNNLIKPFA